MNKCNGCTEQDGTFHHQLVPYRWEIKSKTRKVLSFLCQQCFQVIHIADVHEWNAAKKEKEKENYELITLAECQIMALCEKHGIATEHQEDFKNFIMSNFYEGFREYLQSDCNADIAELTDKVMSKIKIDICE